MPQNWINRYNQRINGETPSDGKDDFDVFFELSDYEHKVDVDRAWNRIEQKINKKSSFLPSLLKIAAILILGVGLGYIVLKDIQDKPAYDQIVRAETGVRALLLPDGSKVTLAENSEIQLTEKGFAKDRSVVLEGEAYFEVTKNASPFTISTSQGTITVLGTSFNLRTNGNLEVLVTSGKVEVQTADERKVVNKGEMASTSGKGVIQVAPYTNENLISWKTGYFKFENESLEKVIPYLERYYKVKITSTKSLRKCKITVEFDQAPLKNVVSVISTILNAKGQIDGKKIKFSGEGCN